MTGKSNKLPKTADSNLKGGSRKGKPNKNTQAIKDMILDALSESGGVDYLVARANDPRTASAFLGLVGKILPTQLTGPGDGPIQFKLIERVIVNAKN